MTIRFATFAVAFNFLFSAQIVNASCLDAYSTADEKYSDDLANLKDSPWIEGIAVGSAVVCIAMGKKFAPGATGAVITGCSLTGGMVAGTTAWAAADVLGALPEHKGKSDVFRAYNSLRQNKSEPFAGIFQTMRLTLAERGAFNRAFIWAMDHNEFCDSKTGLPKYDLPQAAAYVNGQKTAVAAEGAALTQVRVLF